MGKDVKAGRNGAMADEVPAGFSPPLVPNPATQSPEEFGVEEAVKPQVWR